MNEREEIIEKIELICLNFIRQLANSTKKNIQLHTVDEEGTHLKFRPVHIAKLAYNLRVLSQIYRLLTTNHKATKRDLYYDYKMLYKEQRNIDSSVTAICQLLDVPRISLNVISCSKGLLFGPLSFLTDSRSLIDCRCQPILIAESLIGLNLLSDVHFILVVEKDATMQKLLDEGFASIFPNGLLATGKGYPDISTRKVLRWLVQSLNVPIFGLFDADPHGMEILLTYKYGSITEKSEGRGANIKDMQWIGLRPSDHFRFPIAANQFLPLSNKDYNKMKRLSRRATGLQERVFIEELDIMRIRRSKMELEAITSIAIEYMSKRLIAPRIVPSLTQ